jgi:REP element-mobilizing transposase RayT
MAHTYTHLLIHVVFGTEERAPLIAHEMRGELYAYMGGTIREMGAVLLAMNSMPDHVHMLVSVPASLAVANLVRAAKANSSRWIHQRWPERLKFAWQQGYGAFSVSESATSQVERYIRTQEEHHRTLSFEDEFRELLKKHNIAFDERYLWK